MLEKIHYSALFVSRSDWLESHFHFSFAEYFNPANMNFGALRVMNDDVVQPNSGFPPHPHRDMEIFSYVLEGELTHGDSMGNQETLYRGDMQYMSAGTGVTHSEMNSHPKNPARFIQTWILPDQKGLKPAYGSKRFSREARLNRWLHVLGDQNSNAEVRFHQDANVYVSELERGQSLAYDLKSDRQAYLKILEGRAQVGGTELNYGDGAKIRDEKIEIFASDDLHVMLIEMAKG
jgi:redox-sensitive bicupin YhaK (pirin superfamily)